jgi:hypothetical protein
MAVSDAHAEQQKTIIRQMILGADKHTFALCGYHGKKSGNWNNTGVKSPRIR